MYDTGSALRVADNGTDLVFAVTVVDGLDVAIISGQTITFSALKLSTMKYWNILTTAFDEDAEPDLIDAPHVEDGVYQYSLANGYIPKKDNFRFHIVAAGEYTADFGFVNSLNNNTAVDLLKKQGYRVEKVSRDELKKQNNQILVEVREMQKDLKNSQLGERYAN